MKKLYIFLLIICLSLVGCGVKNDHKKNNDIKGAFDIKGIITEVDKETSRILVKDSDTGLIWVTLPENGIKENYEAGQEVVIWTKGGIKESFPAQAEALNIELNDSDVPSKNSSTLPTFKFGDEFPPLTPGFIKVGEISFGMSKGGFQWKKDNSIVQTDAASPLQIAENFKPIEVDANSIVSVLIEQNPNLNAYNWSTKENIPNMEKNQITMPGNKGKYIYEVTAKWSNGEVSYTFVVEIK